jgi:D-alanyl-D-alanine endopeptidase (penicillin-binding protein 7)
MQALNWKLVVPALALTAACTTQPVPMTPDGASKGLVVFNSCAKPVWPREDLDAHHEGTVTLAFLVGADGKAKDAKIVKSSGYRGLDDSARDGIAKCEFKPAMKAGQPTESWVHMQYVWTFG